MNATPGQPPGHSCSFSSRNHSCMHWKWPSCPQGRMTMVSFFNGLSHRTQDVFFFLQESQYQYPNLSMIFLLPVCWASALSFSLELSLVINSPQRSQNNRMEDWSPSEPMISSNGQYFKTSAAMPKSSYRCNNNKKWAIASFAMSISVIWYIVWKRNKIFTVNTTFPVSVAWL